MNESSFDIRFACIFALGRRGDPSAIEPLEAQLKSGQLSIGIPHALEDLIEQLKGKSAPEKGPSATDQKNGEAASNSNQAVLDRLDHLDHQLNDMNDRLRRIEASLPGSKSD
jgi:HEAT repeat protein